MSDLKQSFGFNVKFYRKSKNMTQEQLAEKIGLDIRQVGRIENGISFVSAEVLENLSRVLEVDIKKLFEFENIPSGTKNISAVERLWYKIKKIANDKNKLNYINLAFESLTNKEARNKLLIMLQGMELIQK